MKLLVDLDTKSSLPYKLFLSDDHVSYWEYTIERAFKSLHKLSNTDEILIAAIRSYPLITVHESPDTYSYEEFKANNPHLFI